MRIGDRPYGLLDIAGLPALSGPQRDAAERGVDAGGWPFRLEIAADLAAVEAEWRAFEARALGHPFQSYDWLEAWQSTVGARRGTEPFIAIARDDKGSIFLIAPLAIERGLLGRRLVWLAQDANDYNAPLVRADAMTRLSPRAVRVIWKAIVRYAGASDYAHLAKQAPVIGAFDNPFMELSTEGHPCATHMMRLTRPFDAFLEAKRSARSRAALRTKMNRLAREGVVEVRFAETAGERALIVDWLIERKHDQLKGEGVSNVFADKDFGAFFRRLVERGRLEETAVIASMEVAGETAAACFGLVRGDRFYYVTAAYDAERHACNSPGQLLLLKVIERAVEQGLAWFDFTIGDEEYKADWCDETMPMSNAFTAFTWRGSIAVAALVAATRLKGWVKQRPRVFQAARTMRQAMRNVFLGPSGPQEKAATQQTEARPAAERHGRSASEGR